MSTGNRNEIDSQSVRLVERGGTIVSVLGDGKAYREPEARNGESGSSAQFPITPRSVLVGALGMALLAGMNPYMAYVAHTWEVGYGHLVSGVVLLLFLLVAANGLTARWAPRLRLTRSELLVVYGMLIISAQLVHCGGLPFLVSSVTYPIYMATPSNDWAHLIWPHIPFWLRLNSPEAIGWFWEGLPQGGGVPWALWVTPILSWGVFTLALSAAMFCLGALLSKDWVERQRLTYPLVDVPLAVVGDRHYPTVRTSLFRNRVFWLGFALPSMFAILGFIHALFPNVPSPRLHNIRFGPYFEGMGLPWNVFGGHWDLRISIIFSVIGISCLLPGEVSLSLWLFYVLYRVQQLVWASCGFTEGGSTAAVAINPRLFIGFEEAGGFIALSAIILYQSRKAFRAAWVSLLGRESAGPDPYGPLQPKSALVGFVLANLVLFGWAIQAGMSWSAFGLLMGLYYAVLLGCSRLVAAGGVMYTDVAAFPRGVATSTVGALALGYPSLTIYSYLSVIFMYDPNTVMMPQMMNSFKLLHTGRVAGRRFPYAALVGLTVAFLVGTAALLTVVYHYGAGTLGDWPFSGYPQWAFGELDSSMRMPEPPDNWLRFALGLGAGIVLLLTWLNTRFLWWPVSPVGFVIASSYETNRSLWLNVFIAWLVTTLIRRYGGLRLFRATRPAFLGLVLGEFLTKGALGLIAPLFGVSQSLSFS